MRVTSETANRVFLTFVCCIAVAHSAFGAIRNDRFEAALDPQTAQLTVRDLQSGTTYRECAIPGLQVSDLRESASSLTFTLNARWSVRIELKDSHIDLTIDGDPGADFDSLDYPGGLVVENAAEQALLLPSCAGLMIPFAKSRDPHFLHVTDRSYQTMVDQWGLSMPWIGTVDGEVGSYLQALNADDAEFYVDALDGGYAYRLQWLSVKGKFSYARKARYCFAESGGYVRLCKIFRQYAREQGWLVTLREKLERNPDVDKMVGMLNVWINERPKIELLKDMKRAGIRDALVSYHVPIKMFTEGDLLETGRNLPTEVMTRDFAEQAQALGYMVGRHHELRTIDPLAGKKAPRDRLWPDMDIMHIVGWPEQASVDKNGNIVQGFRRGGHRCMSRQLELAQIYLPADQDRVGYNAHMLDTHLAVPLVECYSPYHPLTRAEDVQRRYDIFQLANDLNFLAGSENVPAWAVPVVHYSEGPSTLVRFIAGVLGDTGPGTNPITVTELYWNITLNEEVRVPLWQLVFHDCVVSANRWNWTPNLFNDRSAWEKENLISILHGQTPTYFLNSITWEQGKDMIARSYKDVCEWNNRIGYDEMRNHRFLTEDKTVQESVFESERRVIVNFGDAAYEAPDGTVVEPWSFTTLGG